MRRGGTDIGRVIDAHDQRPEMARPSFRDRILDADGAGRRLVRRRHSFDRAISAQMIDAKQEVMWPATSPAPTRDDAPLHPVEAR